MYRENLKKMWTVQVLKQVSRKSECKSLIKSSHRVYRIVNGRSACIVHSYYGELGEDESPDDQVNVKSKYE